MFSAQKVDVEDIMVQERAQIEYEQIEKALKASLREEQKRKK